MSSRTSYLSAGPQLWSAGILAVESLVALVAALWWGWQLARGASPEVARVLVEMVIFLLGAAFFAALAHGLAQGHRWPRTPTVVWHGLLVPVAVSLWQSGETLTAALVTLGVTAAVLGILLSRPVAEQ